MGEATFLTLAAALAARIGAVVLVGLRQHTSARPTSRRTGADAESTLRVVSVHTETKPTGHRATEPTRPDSRRERPALYLVK